MKQLRRFFSIVVSVQDVARGKPAPDVFLRTAELLAVPSARCCVIEDSAAGVQAARAAGMEVIAITNTLPAERLALANRIVKTYEEIEALLLQPETWGAASALHPCSADGNRSPRAELREALAGDGAGSQTGPPGTRPSAPVGSGGASA